MLKCLTTAKNSALNFNKKFKREVLSEDDELYKNKEQFGESLETEFIEKEEVLYKKQFHEKIMAALSKKNPRWYEAIILVYYMDIPQVKVAEIMEIRKEVLHALLHRLRNGYVKSSVRSMKRCRIKMVEFLRK